MDGNEVKLLDAARHDAKTPLKRRLEAQSELIECYACAGYGWTEARDLGHQIGQSAWSLKMREDDSGYVPLPKLSLKQLLDLASGPHLSVVNEDGTSDHSIAVADRGVAACYVFERFGRNPEGVLEAMGYCLSQDDAA
ncbi:MAG: hypothetical protein AAGA46_00370 [Cyanobacteria bacterium P01_F01_bin.13]